jgi:hypothetical protein
MSKYSDREREAIIRESHELLAEDWQRGNCCSPLDSPVVSYSAPIETLKERHLRELAERDRAWEVERARDAGVRSSTSELEIANQRIGSVEVSILEVARGVNKLGEGVSDELTALREKNTQLAAQVARLEVELANLQTKRSSRKAKPSGEIIDLPSVRVAQ